MHIKVQKFTVYKHQYHNKSCAYQYKKIFFLFSMLQFNEKRKMNKMQNKQQTRSEQRTHVKTQKKMWVRNIDKGD